MLLPQLEALFAQRKKSTPYLEELSAFTGKDQQGPDHHALAPHRLRKVNHRLYASPADNKSLIESCTSIRSPTPLAADENVVYHGSDLASKYVWYICPDCNKWNALVVLASSRDRWDSYNVLAVNFVPTGQK
jgi:hypothetical protein